MIKITLTPQQKRLWLGGGAIVVVLAAAIVGAVLFHAKAKTKNTVSPVVACANCTSPSPSASATATPTPIPMVARKLDGVLVPVGQENIRPLAVMIENHPDARPQSGLSKANLVYEAIAEGGITRFMAVFADPLTSVRVGPTRSARTYFLDFATELNALYAHVGGNIDALDQIRLQGGVGDLDEFSVGAPTYQRDFSRNVAIEHTMYSTTDKLWDYATTKRADATTSNYTGWQFADAADPANRGTAQTATITFSSALYTVGWTYDKMANLYSRSLAGAPQLDAIDNSPITASNIILQTVIRTHITTRIGEDGWRFTLTGTGNGTLLQNGIATPITWKKSGTDRTLYYDSSGKEISFVRGTTWVELVHPDTKVVIQ